MTQGPLERLRHHVTGAIERGEKEAITEMPTRDTIAWVRMYNSLGCKIGIWDFDEWREELAKGYIEIQAGDRFSFDAD